MIEHYLILKNHLYILFVNMSYIQIFFSFLLNDSKHNDANFESIFCIFCMFVKMGILENRIETEDSTICHLCAFNRKLQEFGLLKIV